MLSKDTRRALIASLARMPVMLDPTQARTLVSDALKDTSQGKKLVAAIRFGQAPSSLAREIVSKLPQYGGLGSGNYLVLVLQEISNEEALPESDQALFKRALDEMGAREAQTAEPPEGAPSPTERRERPDETPGSPNPRLALVVVLERQGEDVRVHIEVSTATGGRVSVAATTRTGAEWASVTKAPDIDLRSIQRDAHAMVRLGEGLARLIFGDGPQQAAWISKVAPSGAASQVSLLSVEMDLLVESDDEELVALPWRCLAWQGSTLEQKGWSVGVSKRGLPRPRSVEVPRKTKILLIGIEEEDLYVEEHFEKLKRGLRDAAPMVRIERVTQRAELEPKLEDFQPHIIYFYGHGRGGPWPQLMLDDPLNIADLKNQLHRFAEPPRVVYLNACSTGANGLLGGGRILNPVVPYVFVNPATVDAAYARDVGGRTLMAILGGAQPEAALRSVAVDLGLQDAVNPILWRRGESLVVI